MGRQKRESFGMMRVREVLREAKEVRDFENAYDVLAKTYYNGFEHTDARLFLNGEYVIGQQELKKCFVYANYIFKLAEAYNIYLDRPNDPMSCFVFGIANSFMPSSAKVVA